MIRILALSLLSGFLAWIPTALIMRGLEAMVTP